MKAPVNNKPIETNRKELEAENKLLKKRLSNLGSLISSMADFEKEHKPHPVFHDIIEEIQKVLQKYEGPSRRT